MSFEKLLIGVFGFIIAGLLVFAPYVCYQDWDQKQRLMAQCIQDGRKEYECWSIIRGGSSRKRSMSTPVFMMVR